MCDHLIGIMNDDGEGFELVRLSEKEKITDQLLREYKEWRKRGNARIVKLHDEWDRDQHFNNALIKFIYCPDCGERNS